MWGKFRSLFLPIIGVDKNHIGLDYKDTNVYMNLNDNVVDTGGELYATGGSNQLRVFKSIPGEWNTCTNMLICTSEGHEIVAETTSGCSFLVRDDNLRVERKIGTIALGSGAKYTAAQLNNLSTSLTLEALINVSGIALMMCNFNKTTMKVWIKDTQGNLNTNSTIRGGAGSISDTIYPTYYYFSLASGCRYNILADFTQQLTDDESIKVLNAAEALRNAFKS